MKITVKIAATIITVTRKSSVTSYNTETSLQRRHKRLNRIASPRASQRHSRVSRAHLKDRWAVSLCRFRTSMPGNVTERSRRWSGRARRGVNMKEFREAGRKEGRGKGRKGGRKEGKEGMEEGRKERRICFSLFLFSPLPVIAGRRQRAISVN